MKKALITLAGAAVLAMAMASTSFATEVNPTHSNFVERTSQNIQQRYTDDDTTEDTEFTERRYRSWAQDYTDDEEYGYGCRYGYGCGYGYNDENGNGRRGGCCRR